MRINYWILAAALTLASAAVASGQAAKGGLLDQALDDAAPPTEAKKDPAPDQPKNQAVDPARPTPPKPQTDVINPDAAKAVDEEDLVKKLTGGSDTGTPGGGANQMLQEVLDRMDASAKRLHAQDPGPVTQETQRRIVVNLDALIELAKQQQSSGSSQSSGQRPGQQRERNPGGGQGQNSQGGNQAAQQSIMPAGDARPAESNGQDIREKGKEWGNLPDRDRDLVVHGSKEDTLPSYREMVQRYYQALSDLGKSTRDNR